MKTWTTIAIFILILAIVNPQYCASLSTTLVITNPVTQSTIAANSYLALLLTTTPTTPTSTTLTTLIAYSSSATSKLASNTANDDYYDGLFRFLPD